MTSAAVLLILLLVNANVFIADDFASRVSCASTFDARCSVARVREAYFHLTGTWCTEAQALVACYSVPDGAPVDMAAVNIGPSSLDDAQAAHFERMRTGVRNLARTVRS